MVEGESGPGAVSLSVSEGRFRAIFEAAAVGTAISNLEGRIIEANHALQDLLGYEFDDMRGMKFPQFTHPDDASEQAILFDELVKGRHDYYRIEKRYVRKDGRTVWGRVTESLVRNPHGDPDFTVAMVEDITVQRQVMEERLRLLSGSTEGQMHRAYFGYRHRTGQRKADRERS